MRRGLIILSLVLIFSAAAGARAGQWFESPGNITLNVSELLSSGQDAGQAGAVQLQGWFLARDARWDDAAAAYRSSTGAVALAGGSVAGRLDGRASLGRAILSEWVARGGAPSSGGWNPYLAQLWGFAPAPVRVSYLLPVMGETVSLNAPQAGTWYVTASVIPARVVPIPEPVFFQMGALAAMGGLGMFGLRKRS